MPLTPDALPPVVAEVLFRFPTYDSIHNKLNAHT